MTPRFPDLEGKHVLITGGGNGIGAAVAVAFAGQGCRVTLLDKDVAAGERVVTACRARSGSGAALYTVDLTDTRALCDALARIRRELPCVDVLIANAGYDPRFELLDMSDRQ
jgi:NAD(P)-dependent dehydrogenase (short-subunit alcohol dehydrogenase family)